MIPEPTILAARMCWPDTPWFRQFRDYDHLLLAGHPADEAYEIARKAEADRSYQEEIRRAD